MALGLEMSLSGSYTISKKVAVENDNLSVFDQVEEHIKKVSKSYNVPMAMTYIDTGDTIIFRWYPSE